MLPQVFFWPSPKFPLPLLHVSGSSGLTTVFKGEGLALVMVKYINTLIYVYYFEISHLHWSLLDV
jgi:hypothetical protein